LLDYVDYGEEYQQKKKDYGEEKQTKKT